MSAWDGKKVIRFPSEPVDGYPDWTRFDCGCCAGTKWGGEYPIECDSCAGWGTYCRHNPTGTIAQWPGGPLLGREVRK